MKRIAGSIGLFVAIVLATASASGQVLQITDVTLSFKTETFQPTAANDNDWVVGNYTNSGGATLGFLYTGPDIPTQTISAPGSVHYTRANGVNDSNTIVGDFFGSDGAYHGYVYSGGAYSLYNLPGFDEKKNKFSTSLFGISDVGNLAGAASPKGSVEGFVVIGGTTYEFYAAGTDNTYAVAVNDAGLAVGEYFVGTTPQGFMWTAADGVTPVNYPGAAWTVCSGVNNSGVIVGSYQDSSGFVHGFTFTNGTFTTTDLDGAGINNNGSVVGTYLAPGGTIVGFQANPASFPSPTPITFKSAESTSVYGIDVAEDMVGQYTDLSGVNHGMVAIGSKLITLDDPNAFGNSTACQGISNNRDIICNYSDSAGNSHADVFAKGTFSPISISGSSATLAYGISINDIAGTFVDLIGNQHGFLLRGGVNGELIQLDVPGATFTLATGVVSVGDGDRVTLFWGDSAGYIESSVYSYPANTYTKANLPGATNSFVSGIDNDGDLTYTWTDGEGNIHAGFHSTAGEGYYYLLDFPGGTGTRTYGVVSEIAGPVIVGRYLPTPSSTNFSSFRWETGLGAAVKRKEP